MSFAAAYMNPTRTHAGMDVNSMLRDMGRVLEFSNAKQGAATGRQERMRHYDSQEQSIAGTTRRLLSFACQVGWVAVSELLLPIATAMGATASELVADLERVADEGLTLLHHIVRTRNASLVGPHLCCAAHLLSLNSVAVVCEG